MRRALSVVTLGVAVAVAAATPAGAQAPVEVSFWYGVGGQLQKVIESQAEKFSKSHPGIKVVPFWPFSSCSATCRRPR